MQQKRKQPKKRKAIFADDPTYQEVEQRGASPVLVNNDEVAPRASYREEEAVEDTVLASSPNAAGTNETYRDTTDMSTVTEKKGNVE